MSPAFSHLKHTYAEFMDMEREEKTSLIKRLFNYMQNERVLLNSGYILDEEEISLSETQVTSHSHYKTQEGLQKGVSDRSFTNVPELNCQESLRNDVHEVSLANKQAQNIQGNLSKDAPEMTLRHHRLPFKPEDFYLTAKFNIPKESVEDMFRNACDLLDAPNSITKVASMDERVRCVRSDDGVSPLIITQVRKIEVYCSVLVRHTVYLKYVIKHWLPALILGYPFITF